MGILIAIVISYIVASFFGYVIHWSLHQTWTGFLNKAHMSHHLEKYPPNDYTSDVYRHAGQFSTPRYFFILTIPVIMVPILLTIFHVIPLYGLVIFLLMSGLMGLLHDRIHDAFHINNHWMSKVPILKVLYKKWSQLHYIHHVDMSKNFSIFIFTWDRIFKTYQK